jgi:hypothetical protein
LPNGIFLKQQFQCRHILDVHGTENVGICHGHTEYSTAIWYSLLPFGISYGHLVYLMAIWYILWPFGVSYGHLVYLMAIWYILWPFGIFDSNLVHIVYGHLVRFVVIMYIYSRFGMFYQDQFGNPGQISVRKFTDAFVEPIVFFLFSQGRFLLPLSLGTNERMT